MLFAKTNFKAKILVRKNKLHFNINIKATGWMGEKKKSLTTEKSRPDI